MSPPLRAEYWKQKIDKGCIPWFAPTEGGDFELSLVLRGKPKTHAGDVPASRPFLTIIPLPPPPIPTSSRIRRSRSLRSKRRQSIATEPAAVEDRPPDPIFSSTFSSKLDQLLKLITRQDFLTSEQSRVLKAQNEDIKAELRAQLHTMNKHTAMLQTLETDATKGMNQLYIWGVADAQIDDKAYEGRKLGDAQTRNTPDQETLAKIKVMIEEWREVMHISLIFLPESFLNGVIDCSVLTVVTAFISSVIQMFMTPPDSSSTRSRLPTVPTLLMALFYYLALITNISNSVLCVLGRQWSARLLATPFKSGKTILERALARERRMLIQS
ncbi:hypothetical protein SISNIDRAFT_469156 [Sistotremastrum niveocremeum HHB9708]|uniref:DUF6535 domain-containing protein n=1 Tax=Sistotremastrum niveocremeum HHB9708 TaxID=1314777 RepID=A0A164QGF9_9AGAM|nr:hypothetical protein SISNIDRAFT_469156 [Sistotremastrum niveocremeum HHB9708]